MTEQQLKQAEKVYTMMRAAFDEGGLAYDSDDGELTLRFTTAADDLPMEFLIAVDAERRLVRFMSLLPFKFAADRRLDGAIATSYINDRIVDGSFDYDYRSGKIIFRMTTSFMESLISKELLTFMTAYAVRVLDSYNDKLFALAKGFITVEQFMKD